MYNKNIIKKVIIENGGITVNKNGIPVQYKTGYQVSIKDGIITDNIDIAIEYMENNRASGVWYDNGLYYVDYSVRIATKKNAIVIGKNNNQLSIFDWKHNNCITL